ncbi:MAG TPA: EamA family transporter, partial [Steroidobacteraceae bacterium]|nr:EamA family transporter [Steroidobacteraceae bacterium]
DSLSSRRAKLIACFAIVYFVWGSSYVAMKIGTRHLEPAAFAGLRFTLAGVLLGLFAWTRGARLPTGWTEWRHVLLMGFLTVFVSAGINNFVIQWVPSNQSALINATSAFWIAGLGTLGPRGHSLSTRARWGLVIGFVGAALLVWPREGFAFGSVGPPLAIVFACAAWALGTLYYRSVGAKTDPLMFTGLQLLVGGVLLLFVAVGTGGLRDMGWSWAGMGTLLYLVIFSSCLGYSAYAWLMVNTTPDKLGTYSYVNPAVAAVLGWIFLGEVLTGVQLIGMAVIMGGFALVTWRPRPPDWWIPAAGRKP